MGNKPTEPQSTIETIAKTIFLVNKGVEYI